MSIKLSKHKLGSVNEILCSRQKVTSRLKSRSNFLSTWGKQRINLYLQKRFLLMLRKYKWHYDWKTIPTRRKSINISKTYHIILFIHLKIILRIQLLEKGVSSCLHEFQRFDDADLYLIKINKPCITSNTRKYK